MTFADIPVGAAIFLDANPLVYYFSANPLWGPACQVLIEQVERNELHGFTSAAVLGEVVHRLMTIEAMALFGWSAQGIANRLRRHPAEVQQLKQYRRALDEITLLNIVVLPTVSPLISKAADVSQQLGLLSADALIVTTMREQGLTHLASHDADFDRVPGIIRYAPG